MRTWLESGDTAVEQPDASAIESLRAAGTAFWLDVEGPTDDVIDRLARELDLHPLAVEDSKAFGQRGKLVVYGEVVMTVEFGLDADNGEPVEVHGYATKQFLLTFRHSESAALERLHTDGTIRKLLGAEPVRVLHQLATELHAEFPPYVDVLDDRLTAVDKDMLDAPNDESLTELTAIRVHADSLRRTLTPGREILSRPTVPVNLPGATSDAGLYASDIADELASIIGDLVAISERSTTSVGLIASLASNRQAIASRQLAAVATVFLPITFVVGFFGMNFDVLINHFEQGWIAFGLLGVLLNVACVIATVWLLGRRGWR